MAITRIGTSERASKIVVNNGIVCLSGQVAEDPDSDIQEQTRSTLSRVEALLVEAGLTPFEALATGTRNAARIAKRMGQDGEWGTIEEEHRADLILLPMNPLEDVTHTRDRLGVMVRGQWFTQPELDTLVDTFVATY